MLIICFTGERKKRKIDKAIQQILIICFNMKEGRKKKRREKETEREQKEGGREKKRAKRERKSKKERKRE